MQWKKYMGKHKQYQDGQFPKSVINSFKRLEYDSSIFEGKLIFLEGLLNSYKSIECDNSIFEGDEIIPQSLINSYKSLECDNSTKIKCNLGKTEKSLKEYSE